MKLTVLSVAYPLTPVGPDAVGGSEQILTLLDSALTRAGHHSIVVACDGSVISGTLLGTPKWNGVLTPEIRRWAQRRHRMAIEQALKQWPVDIVHMHSLDFWRYMPSGLPVMATLHLPPDWYPWEVFYLRRPHTYVHCVSQAQAARCPADAKMLPPIENGVDIDRLTIQLRKREFALALGRVCPEKGLHYALDAATAADVPLFLAGEVFKYKAHVDYYKTEIEPRLGRYHRFLGPAGFRKKRRLMTQARCLLIPSTVAETSSLVAMEALSCGTPVIAFPSGALPEIIEDGKTGFLVQDQHQMAEALKAVHFLDPEVCRREARQRFSAERMTGRYIERYQELTTRAIEEGPTRTRTAEFGHFEAAERAS